MLPKCWDKSAHSLIIIVGRLIQTREPSVWVAPRRSGVMNIHAGRRPWPAEGLTRVPYWLYTDRDLYAQEQERIFRGNTWTFLCMEAELPKPNTSPRVASIMIQFMVGT